VHACIEVDPARRPASTESFLSVLEPIVSALEGMQAMETSASGRYGILRDGPASTALALPARRPPFGPPPMYDGSVPPPPAYDALDAGLSRVHSRPNHNDSLLSTPVDMDYRSGPSHGAWWALASLGLVLLLLLTVGVWWQMWRERNAGEGTPQPGAQTGVSGDDGKVVVVKGDGGDSAEGGATKTAGGTGPGDPDPPGSTEGADDAKAEGGAGADDAAEGGNDGGAATTNPLESAKCKRTRQTAKEAFINSRWSQLLTQLNVKACWKGKYRSDVADMKIKALFETKQFAKCAALEKSARSASSKNTVKICIQRAAMAG
jgi:hypothetical protein